MESTDWYRARNRTEIYCRKLSGQTRRPAEIQNWVGRKKIQWEIKQLETLPTCTSQETSLELANSVCMRKPIFCEFKCLLHVTCYIANKPTNFSLTFDGAVQYDLLWRRRLGRPDGRGGAAGPAAALAVGVGRRRSGHHLAKKVDVPDRQSVILLDSHRAFPHVKSTFYPYLKVSTLLSLFSYGSVGMWRLNNLSK